VNQAECSTGGTPQRQRVRCHLLQGDKVEVPSGEGGRLVDETRGTPSDVPREDANCPRLSHDSSWVSPKRWRLRSRCGRCGGCRRARDRLASSSKTPEATSYDVSRGHRRIGRGARRPPRGDRLPRGGARAVPQRLPRHGRARAERPRSGLTHRRGERTGRGRMADGDRGLSGSSAERSPIARFLRRSSSTSSNRFKGAVSEDVKEGDEDSDTASEN
jgi:hypothetical protein